MAELAKLGWEASHFARRSASAFPIDALSRPPVWERTWSRVVEAPDLVRVSIAETMARI